VSKILTNSPDLRKKLGFSINKYIVTKTLKTKNKMENSTRHVISKSSKRKMSTPTKQKANGFTEMVVYKTKVNGIVFSQTRHELLYR